MPNNVNSVTLNILL